TFNWKWIFIPFFIILAIFGFTYIVMLLWNYVFVDMYPAAELTFYKAMALLVLSKILFGGFKGGNGFGGKANGWKNRMKNMTDEEKEAMKAEWKQRCEMRG
ncbi:MAG: hypothetical protein HYZ42_01255, partial [Bacteroidetes bacterium]|nr:hypothetical protein [Bacteroidota bacterium]